MYTLTLLVVFSLLGSRISAVPLIVSSSSARSIKLGDPQGSNHQYKQRTSIGSPWEISTHDGSRIADGFRDSKVSTLTHPQVSITKKYRSLKSMTTPRHHNYVKVSRKTTAKNPLDQKRKPPKTTMHKLERRVGGSTKAPVSPSRAPSQPSSKVKFIYSKATIVYNNIYHNVT
jgi:hypothetical protein